MVLRKWVIEFCLFGVIFIVKRVSNGSFLQSPWVFPPSRSGAFTPVFVMAENGSDLSWKVDEN